MVEREEIREIRAKYGANLHVRLWGGYLSA